MRKIFSTLLLLSAVSMIFAQSKYDEISVQQRNNHLQQLYQSHPIFPKQIPDTSIKQYAALPNYLQLFNHSLTTESNNHFHHKIYPLVNFSIGSNLMEDDFRYNTGLGIKTIIGYKDKITFTGSYTYNQFSGYQFIDEYIQDHSVIPNGSLSHGDYYHDLSFHLDWKPNRIFTLSAGFDEQFIGNGYRSLFLSDDSYSLPYFSINANIWKLDYTAKWINMKDIQTTSSNQWSDFEDKYAAMHYLSWQLTKKFRIGFFEAVVWQGTNEQGERGFEVNYLNPIIFFRPVEFAIGSPDNAMIGLDFDYIHKKQLFYFQLMLDEFKYEEISAQNGWWANKQSFQVGWRSFDLFRKKNLHLLTEFNYIRPFMYSHRTPLQSYGHLNQPLAHPAGANIAEGILQLTYSKDRFFFSFHNTFSVFGTDPEGENYGGDIFMDYDTYTKEYDNYVGQGITNRLLNSVFEISYLLNHTNHLNLFSRMAMRHHQIEEETNTNLYFEVGISNVMGGLGSRWMDY